MLRKNARSRSISIRVRGTADRNGCRISVTVPWSLRYQDGIGYLEKRRGWIRAALAKQAERSEAAASEGRSVAGLRDGVCVKTLLSHIVFKDVSGTDNAAGTGAVSGRHDDGPSSGTSHENSLKVRVRTARVENPEDSGRLWLSLDKPLSLKLVSFGSEPSCGAGGAAGNAALEKVLVEILREEAKILIPQKAALFAQQYGFRYRKLTIKHNSSNWGSCSRAGNLNLNLNLVRLPEPLCDYVILHELCHLKEPNHGPKFHALLESLCICNIRHLLDIGSPDAEKYEAWLTAAGRTESALAGLFKRAAFRAALPGAPGMPVSSSLPSVSCRSLPPLDEVLSREITSWRMV